jgi:NADPH-dependent F420 reductase
MKIAVIGGTGDLGRGLAARLSRKYEVLVGSREAAKAVKSAEELRKIGGSSIIGLSNDQAAGQCDSAIIAIPSLPSYDMLATLKAKLKGKLVISPVVPMTFERGVFSYDLSEGSAAEKIAGALESRVVAAFHTVPAEKLLSMNEVLDYDVLVAADSRADYSEASVIISSIEKLRPLYCGGLRNSRTIESLTPLLLNVGRQNKIRSPSVKVV